VERHFQSKNFLAAGVFPSQLDRSLNSLGARVAKERFLLIAGSNLRQLLPERRSGFVWMQVRAAVNELVKLVLGGFDDSFVSVADIRHCDTGKDVEILVAIEVFDGTALSTFDWDVQLLPDRH
jgi:hypothetical protein